MADLPVVTVPRRRAVLEVYGSPASELGSPDRVVRIDGKLVVVLGRARTCDVLLPHDSVARRHTVLRFEGDAWTAEDTGSTNGTWLDGERIQRVRLGDGALLTVGRVRVRLLLSETAEPRCPALVERLCEAPEDDARWQVYADWLLEHGLAIGPRTSGEAPDAACLERLEPEVRRGAVQLTWRHGLIEAAELTLRPHGELEAADLGGLLAGLAELPAASALQRLTARVTGAVVEFPTARPVFEQLRGRFVAVREGVRGAGPWPALSSLQVGPVWGEPDDRELAAALAGLEAACPRLVGPPARWLLAFGEAFLDVERPARGPGPGEGVRGRLPLEGHTLQLGGLVFRHVPAGWHVMAAPGVRTPWSVNGVAESFLGAMLMPGDVVRQGDDFNATFGARPAER